MSYGPKVSAEVGEKLAAKYPRFASVAAGATVGPLVNGDRKYRMPDGSVVVLAEPAPAEVDVLRARVATLEAEVASAKAPKAEAKAETKKEAKAEK